MYSFRPSDVAPHQLVRESRESYARSSETSENLRGDSYENVVELSPHVPAPNLPGNPRTSQFVDIHSLSPVESALL